LKGTDVTLITDEDVPHAARLGPEPGRQIGAWLRAAGVDLRLGSGVAAIERVGDDWTIRLVDSSTVTAEVVISASGAQPTAGTRLADHAGLTVDQGGVAVDERLRTDDETVWAVGDLAYAYHPAAGRRLRVEHWADAETMGEIAGADIAAAEAGQRGERTWTVAPGFWTTIGDQVLKYSAWGDGYDQSRLVAGEGDGWAVWYGLDGIVVGVLTHNWDEAYDRGGKLLAEGADYQSAVSS
ncbi:MAG: FAD-dependent oxidoreductase, partial [Microlunatus sp.]|nr:FAD-dependent oxidoreductase [Microlunatus sp.]